MAFSVFETVSFSLNFKRYHYIMIMIQFFENQQDTDKNQEIAGNTTVFGINGHEYDKWTDRQICYKKQCCYVCWTIQCYHAFPGQFNVTCND